MWHTPAKYVGAVSGHPFYKSGENDRKYVTFSINVFLKVLIYAHVTRQVGDVVSVKT